jgi:hypothetical protein
VREQQLRHVWLSRTSVRNEEPRTRLLVLRTNTSGCSWLLPRKTRGKRLVVFVQVAYQGRTAVFSQTFKIT